jgi:hypothetical protein
MNAVPPLRPYLYELFTGPGDPLRLFLLAFAGMNRMSSTSL